MDSSATTITTGNEASELPQNERIDRHLVDTLVERIQDRINNGDFPVGSWLRQERLAGELGVSRMPIREALRQLQAMGSVEMIANRGARVRVPSTLDVIEVYELHAILQSHAGAAAADLITSDQLERLTRAESMFREAITELEASPDMAKRHWYEANSEFHAVIIEASGNKQLADMIEILEAKVPRNLNWIALGNDIRRLKKDAVEHTNILKAISSGDAEKAQRLLTEHVKRAGDLLVRALDEFNRT